MKTTYKITRFGKKTSTLADSVCVICAKSNGMDDGKISLNDIEGYIKCEALDMPYTYKNLTITRIDDFHLIVDLDCEPLLEVMEIEELEVPTLDAYNHSAN